jgi:DNA-binding transcriptional regulator YiaG
MPRRGRPSLGHAGHPQAEAECEACWLRRWRESHGWSQAEAAYRVPSGRSYHTPLRTYHRWERGEVPPPILVMRLLRMLRAPVSR